VQVYTLKMAERGHPSSVYHETWTNARDKYRKLEAERKEFVTSVRAQLVDEGLV
jgi:hypothetical protein